MVSNFMNREQWVAGRYRCLYKLGRGGFSEVYLAEDTRLGNRKVALKRVAAHLLHDDERMIKFRQEAQIIGHLTSPYTVRAYDYGQEEDGRFYIAMEYVPGETLHDVLKRERRLSIDRGVKLGIQILDALEEAHQMRVIHRDLKPKNVMLIPHRHGDLIKVLDFGVARILRGDLEGKDDEWTLVGTATYMAPEQAQGYPVSPASDLYSVGVILYHVFTGRPPFISQEDPVAVMIHHAISRVQTMREIHPELHIPQELDAIVLHALEKNPEHRYQTASDFCNDLEAFWENWFRDSSGAEHDGETYDEQTEALEKTQHIQAPEVTQDLSDELSPSLDIGSKSKATAGGVGHTLSRKQPNDSDHLEEGSTDGGEPITPENLAIAVSWPTTPEDDLLEVRAKSVLDDLETQSRLTPDKLQQTDTTKSGRDPLDDLETQSRTPEASEEANASDNDLTSIQIHAIGSDAGATNFDLYAPTPEDMAEWLDQTIIPNQEEIHLNSSGSDKPSETEILAINDPSNDFMSLGPQDLLTDSIPSSNELPDQDITLGPQDLPTESSPFSLQDLSTDPIPVYTSNQFQKQIDANDANSSKEEESPTECLVPPTPLSSERQRFSMRNEWDLLTEDKALNINVSKSRNNSATWPPPPQVIPPVAISSDLSAVFPFIERAESDTWHPSLQRPSESDTWHPTSKTIPPSPFEARFADSPSIPYSSVAVAESDTWNPTAKAVPPSPFDERYSSLHQPLSQDISNPWYSSSEEMRKQDHIPIGGLEQTDKSKNAQRFHSPLAIPTSISPSSHDMPLPSGLLRDTNRPPFSPTQNQSPAHNQFTPPPDVFASAGYYNQDARFKDRSAQWVEPFQHKTPQERDNAILLAPEEFGLTAEFQASLRWRWVGLLGGFIFVVGLLFILASTGDNSSERRRQQEEQTYQSALQQGDREIAESQYRKAYLSYRRALLLRPDSEEARYRMSRSKLYLDAAIQMDIARRAFKYKRYWQAYHHVLKIDKRATPGPADESKSLLQQLEPYLLESLVRQIKGSFRAKNWHLTLRRCQILKQRSPQHPMLNKTCKIAAKRYKRKR
jgi:serine/threonine protein kinase